MEKIDYLPLFETKSVKGIIPLFRLFAASIFVGRCLIFVYRVSHTYTSIKNEEEEEALGKWAWIGLFLSELWFTLYWLVCVVVRWKPSYRRTFKDSLSLRSGLSLFFYISSFCMFLIVAKMREIVK